MKTANESDNREMPSRAEVFVFQDSMFQSTKIIKLHTVTYVEKIK